MRRLRISFMKTGRAVWISHLDLMRLFQRAFVRAGVAAWHTEGFNPHLYISIACPLSVGMEGEGELLDFESEAADPAAIADRLNRALPEGIRVRACYEALRPFKEIAFADWNLSWPEGGKSVEELQKLFSAAEVTVLKKTKSGESMENIVPLIKTVSFCAGDGKINCTARLCSGARILNPAYLSAAAGVPAGQAGYVRTAFLDAGEQKFK